MMGGKMEGREVITASVGKVGKVVGKIKRVELESVPHARRHAGTM